MDLCDKTTLYLTDDGLKDISVVAGAGGAPSLVIGRRENSEAEVQRNSALCGDYSEISLVSVPEYPSSVKVLGSSSLEILVDDPGENVFDQYIVTVEFHLVNYPSIVFSQHFKINVYNLEGHFPD